MGIDPDLFDEAMEVSGRIIEMIDGLPSGKMTCWLTKVRDDVATIRDYVDLHSGASDRQLAMFKDIEYQVRSYVRSIS